MKGNYNLSLVDIVRTEIEDHLKQKKMPTIKQLASFRKQKIVLVP